MLWCQKKIKDLLLDRYVEDKLGNIPNTAGLGGLSRLFWPYGALTRTWLSPPKPSGPAVSLLLCTVGPHAWNPKATVAFLMASHKVCYGSRVQDSDEE